MLFHNGAVHLLDHNYIRLYCILMILIAKNASYDDDIYKKKITTIPITNGEMMGNFPFPLSPLIPSFSPTPCLMSIKNAKPRT